MPRLGFRTDKAGLSEEGDQRPKNKSKIASTTTLDGDHTPSLLLGVHEHAGLEPCLTRNPKTEKKITPNATTRRTSLSMDPHGVISWCHQKGTQQTVASRVVEQC